MNNHEESAPQEEIKAPLKDEGSEPTTLKEKNSSSTETPKAEENAELKVKATLSENPLEKKVSELEIEVKEKESKYLYLYADFENYKKRSVKERSELIKFGSEPLVRELLQTLDNLERALQHTPEGTDKNLVAGLKMVFENFQSTLKRFGIEAVESLKKDFDPTLHEAVGQEDSDLPEGKIVKEELSGYTLHGRLIRPARVIVSRGSSKK